MVRVNRLIGVLFIVITARPAAVQSGGANTGWSRPIAPYASDSLEIQNKSPLAPKLDR
jgi:hypothetical protein